MLPILWSWVCFAAQGTPASYTSTTHDLNPYPHKPKLHFNIDGTFKLTVLSDLHFGENPWDDWGPEQDVKSLALMRKVLKEEQPDFIVIDGDLITGENTFRENSTLLIDQIVEPLNELRIPFSTVHGNHDNQKNITHAEEIERELKVARHSYTRAAPKGVGGEGGPGNYWIPIYKNKYSTKPLLILWFFDSRGGFSSDEDSHPIDDWVHSSVADFIRSESSKMEKFWGPSTARAALAFVHIPPYRVRVRQATLNHTINPGLNEDKMGEGSSQRKGEDEPFWQALSEIPNLIAVTSGHDHGNEWCARTDGVVFCFAKHSGYGGYGKSWWGFGVRNFVLKGFDPLGPVTTWIRMEDGEARNGLILSDKFDR